MITTYTLLRMFAALAATLGLILLAATLYKRLGQPLPKTASKRRLQAVETLRITPQTTLHLVRLDDTEHLLSITNAQTTVITTTKTPKTK